ncbi:hypothetical protein PF007_g27142 [Phytophthora fragariae]|uniref:Secreted protein n=1 Tax=Phytophthora fragariae TaxID=53985 RepID=A0A6A3Q6U1_9STRA|nr:hypothetical protein PF007_g27142 [Phytophthora fragariae]
MCRSLTVTAIARCVHLSCCEGFAVLAALGLSRIATPPTLSVCKLQYDSCGPSRLFCFPHSRLQVAVSSCTSSAVLT